ncbi:MAG: NAD(+)/NADH kinase [Candidatus Diapherotrites archaeon]
MKKLTRIGITGHFSNQLPRVVAREALGILRKMGVIIEVDDSFLKTKNSIPIGKFNSDLVLVFGGDGTMLRAARKIPGKIPLLGINCGAVGYLMELDFNNLKRSLPEIVNGDFTVEKRSRLELKMKGQKIPFALNEITISPIINQTLMNFSLEINGKDEKSDVSDGLLISTPTGSTAHNLSAGGSLIKPDAEVFSIISLSSMNREIRPMIVNDNSVIKVKGLHFGRNEAVIDGHKRIELAEEVEIRKGKPVLFTIPLKTHIGKGQTIPKTLSPSARFLHKLIQFRGPQTQTELVLETGLPERTVRRSLESLIEHRLILEKSHKFDRRKKIYRLVN